MSGKWEALAETAAATDHVKFNAANLVGREVGKAFLELVIGDPKVQAAGAWLRLERPTFCNMFTDRLFPVETHDRKQQRSPAHGGDLPTSANVGYAHMKPDFQRNRERSLTAHSRPSIPTRATSIRGWGYKWPVVLDAAELTKIFSAEDDTNLNYGDDPTEGPIYHAAKALADQHQAFFDLFRTRQLVGEGTFMENGQELEVGERQWFRRDRWLDIQNSDLLRKDGSALYEGLIFRRPGLGAAAAVTPALSVTVTDESVVATEPNVQGQRKKRGPHERYDYPALMQLQREHLQTNEPFRTPTDHLNWCIENLQLKPGVRPPKGKRKGERPDPHTVANGIKRHKLDKMPGVFVED